MEHKRISEEVFVDSLHELASHCCFVLSRSQSNDFGREGKECNNLPVGVSSNNSNILAN